MCYYEAKFSMGCFGGFSWKPLLVVGSWPGISVLKTMNDYIFEKRKHLKMVKLMDVSATGWRPAVLGPVMRCKV